MSSSESAATGRTLGPGIVLVLVTVLVSGVSNFVNFRAVQGTDVDAWLAVRNAAVAGMLVLVALVAGTGLRTRLSRGQWIRLAAIGLLGGAVPFLLYFHGFQLALSQGGAATASFGYRSLFLMASVLGVVVLRERLTRRWLFAAGALFVGNALLLSVSGPLWTDGTGYVLLATALWAGEYTVSKDTMRGLPSSTVALGRMGFGAVFLFAYLGFTGHAASVAAFGGADWVTLFLSALLLFAFVTSWYAGLRTVDLSVASSLLVLAFPITWVLSVVAGGTAFTLGPAAGAVAIVLGIAILLGVASRRGIRARIRQVFRMRSVPEG